MLQACAALLFVLSGSVSNLAAQDEAAETSDAEGEDTSAAQPANETPADEHSAAGTLNARLLVGAGLSTRRIDLPSSEGWRRVDTGLAPTLSLRVASRWRDGAHFLGVRLSYMTGIHGRATDQVGDPGLAPSQVAIRSHRFEGGLLPGLVLSDARNAGTIALFAGYGVRAFGSVEVLRVPRFSLHGPLVRLELALPLVHWLRLRLAPEAQLITSLSRDLRLLAALPSTAFSIGGEVDLQARWSAAWSLQLSYREAHVAATGVEGKRFEDIERYLLLELAYQVE
jgi:hypothetical protein